MPRRSITDYEIALIKALDARGMRNKDIQFLFNRPDRAVNTGRISTIAKGTYSNSADIPAAADAVLDVFLASRSTTPGGAGPAREATADDGPLADGTILRMFGERATGSRFLHAGESDMHECKKGFGFRHSHKWLRAMAALANNRGGYILFGVDDETHEIVGLDNDEFDKADAARFSEAVRSAFDPTPDFTHRSFDVGGKRVGVIHVRPHPGGPVIARTTLDGDLREGDIFYRYPGRSQRIKYSDLRAILDRRDAAAREQILPMVERLLALGPKRAMIADLTEGILSDGRVSLHIDEKVLAGIALIKEGEFDEVSGAPALRLVGEVQVGAAQPAVFKGAISRKDVLEAFLRQDDVRNPEGYFGFVVDGCAGEWLPFRMFASKAGMDLSGARSFIEATTAPPRRKKLFLDSLEGKRSAFKRNGAWCDTLLASILAGATFEVASLADALDVGRCLQAHPDGPAERATEILKLAATCLTICESDPKGAAGSVVRRAISRLDEIMYPLD
ncbi:ATP-binding protein [Antarcticirhabdus aurantiaca]|uniref:ATP-binding protein n=1 Tax=Antarcticirhabdus aurantiaca TaxID=2606717 RepID=A0ACD4NWB1_9HYPH|nr:ATP-binding protein [Antarcticirhabdus aurantiaca]WAJ31261.1 ATP-binding protein [Jeongeuplla avenae]